MRADVKTDVVIIGGGPAGAASAMFLLREGIQPLIIERETFPRYHIGESMTGEAGGVLRTLGLTDEMFRRKHPVKKGVKVYGPAGKTAWWVPVAYRNENYQLEEFETWQVRRSDFDKMMLEEAVARGANILHGRATTPLLDDDGAVCGVEVLLSNGGVIQIQSEVLVDCSGQSTFLANAGITGPKYLGNYDKQIAIFSQVVGAVRDNRETRDMDKDNTLIFYKTKFHWSWFIPLDDEIVSVGVVIPSAYFLGKRETKETFLRRELHELNPELKRRLPEIQLVEQTRAIKNYSYQVKRFCGKGFICIGDAHRFIDPIFSFGLYVALKESEYVAPVIANYLNGANRDKPNPFAEYQLFCEQGIDVLEDMIDLFWEQPIAFATFVHARYTEELIDIFAGRIYDHQPSTAIKVFRKLLERKRTYESEDVYSVPIGSRFHPERAPLWQEAPPLENMAEWLHEPSGTRSE